jgi:glutathione synthase/RimK-type ligase-like ATP-grasp enzyme
VSEIRFITYTSQPAITSDDALAAKALRNHGISVAAQPWDAPSDCRNPAVLRSCWNYHLNPSAFLSWIHVQEAIGTPFWNHPATVRWNLDKSYLRDLAQRGCPIVPTMFLPRGTEADLAWIMAENDWSAAVVKPSVSATAHRTWTTTTQQAASRQPELDRLLTEHGVLVQKFMPEIQTSGELSLVFFNGAYSHAMKKTAATGDFRVQEEYGGTTIGTIVPANIVEQADRALRTTPGAPHLYARVDGVLSETMFFIMEVELIEPCLYLGTHPQAPARFAAAIAERLSQ